METPNCLCVCGRAFTRDAMGSIPRDGLIELCSSQCSATGVINTVVCAILWDGAYIRTFAANRKKLLISFFFPFFSLLYN